MKTQIVISAFFCLLAVSSADIWKNCGTSSDHLQIKNVVITPDPPVAGNVVNILATGTLDEQITSGNLNINLQYNGFTLFNQNLDLCSTINPVESCPIAAGPVTANVTEMIPSYLPSGQYSGTIKGTDQNSQEIFCIALNFQLGGGKALPPFVGLRRNLRRGAKLN